ncbi:MAG TPA: histidine kinase dimerization/phospho-acceptor domain-containing protein, partial [Gammaproteobacteria bacterium]|nr:histidine kinase dimerization/phospho-acceptor domain-containing protein [Gammaproteobacteria bacterium]
MNPRSIGFRLTVWYAAALTVALLLLAGGMWFAVERSLYDAIDDGLRERVEGIRRFIEDHRDRLALKEVQEEFRAHGDLFQVRDEAGRWLHQADGLRGLTLPPAASEKLPPRFDTVQAGALRLRVISQNVEVGGKTFSIQAAASLRELREGLRRALRVLIPLFATVLIASAAGGYWLSRRALNPVDEITRAARSVTASNLSRRVPVPRTRDELERLSETLNEMIARLESAFKRITHFTADASHELRTPLAVMRTTAEVALRNPDADEHRDALEQILAELGHTTNLVDNLLLMANADSGAERLARTRLDVAEAVREAAAEAAVLARAKSLSFEARLPRDEIWIAGDRQALRRLFLILLDNAVKYTPSGGRVEISAGVISAGVQDARAVICVTDSGVGIA